MTTIASALDAVRVGTPVGAASLMMFPLLAGSEVEPAYLTLDEGLARGTLQVTEVSESGSVPQLLVKNGGPVPVLILDGEELVGAKQNRIVNLTILVPAHSTIEIPVSCVERGRWRHTSDAFASAGRTHYAEARAMKLMQVNACMRQTGDRHADQGAIWNDIAMKSARMDASSETSAAAAMYERAERELARFEEALHAAAGQVGAVFAIDGRIAGLDLFDAPATWHKSMRKLVQSYGLDALDAAARTSDTGEAAHRRAEPDKVAAFLDSVRDATPSVFAAVGVGDDVRLDGVEVAGGALVVDGRVVHLVAFPKRDAGAHPRRRSSRVA